MSFDTVATEPVLRLKDDAGLGVGKQRL